MNGLLCRLSGKDGLEYLYGNVITIKDQWSKTSEKTYSDRLEEQLQAIRGLPEEGTLIGGDFNLRLGWRQKLFAHRQVQDLVSSSAWQ